MQSLLTYYTTGVLLILIISGKSEFYLIIKYLRNSYNNIIIIIQS